ncbi:hypothetical protein [Sphingomonas alpina]|uniref:Serine/threonine protein kinase n=1 Tax=Sphingomonas alpina TaxID=653931 RepID=A0A7H0LH07_9SPHN|nr:hypothetical protein [Sphingomonas alpina]QNQ08960.1 hypothetical protein H3Z74_20020 [Sphingomonas alpina]
MELHDLKLALNQLDARLERQAALQMQMVRREARNTLRDTLTPLARSQTWLIVSGALFCLLGVAAWHGELRHPGGAFASGVILHVYGLLSIAAGVVIKVLVARIDYAEPVVAIQKRLAQLRRAQLWAGIVIGMPWWVLWVPLMIVVLRLLTGVDIAFFASGFLWTLTITGLAGMAATWLVYRWARFTGRQHIVRGFENAFAGEHLKRAQAQLDEITQFERD